MKEVQKRVNKLEENDTIKQDVEIMKMKGQIDDFKQKERDRNIIETGRHSK